MMNLKNRLKSFIKKKKYSIPTLIVLIIIIVALNLGGNDTPEYMTRVAERTDVAQLVSVTGNVTSASAVDLGFVRGGKISRIPVEVGQSVEEGATLAVVANDDLNATLEARLVNLERERISLAELTNGAGGGIESASVRSAETSLENAKLALVDQVNDSAIKLDDAIRNYGDRLFENPESSPNFGVSITSGDTTYNLGTGDSQERIAINRERREIGEFLEEWEPLPRSASAEAAMSAGRDVERALATTQEMLSLIANVINSRSSESSGAQTIYGEYKTVISTARSTANTALTNLRSDLQAYSSAETALDVAEAPGSAEEIAIQELNIRQAEADVAAARAEIAKTVISSPVTGTVTRIDAEVGEIVSSNEPVVSVISESELEIEVNIPEADIAKVRVGALADVTFDAYGNDYVATATVVTIDPAETVIDGVPTYRTILSFSGSDERIRSGLTANVDIKGERREGVVAVPQRAIITRDGSRVVRVLENGQAVEREVEVGLRGSEGLAEITSGLSEGDIIITSSPEDE